MPKASAYQSGSLNVDFMRLSHQIDPTPPSRFCAIPNWLLPKQIRTVKEGLVVFLAKMQDYAFVGIELIDV